MDTADEEDASTRDRPLGKLRDDPRNELLGATEEKAVEVENRKIRFLRFLVDFSILAVQQEDLTFEEASARVEEVKRAACGFFPGKEEVFELVYRPRFNRVLWERFGTAFEEKN